MHTITDLAGSTVVKSPVKVSSYVSSSRASADCALSSLGGGGVSETYGRNSSEKDESKGGNYLWIEMSAHSMPPAHSIQEISS